MRNGIGECKKPVLTCIKRKSPPVSAIISSLQRMAPMFSFVRTRWRNRASIAVQRVGHETGTSEDRVGRGGVKMKEGILTIVKCGLPAWPGLCFQFFA